jgi:hypothetical protein
MLLTSTRNLAEWENVLFCRNRISDSGPWCPLFNPCQRRKHWTGVTKVLELQIINETSPQVKALISSSHGVVPSVSFPASPTAEASESLG